MNLKTCMLFNKMVLSECYGYLQVNKKANISIGQKYFPDQSDDTGTIIDDDGIRTFIFCIIYPTKQNCNWLEILGCRLLKIKVDGDQVRFRSETFVAEVIEILYDVTDTWRNGTFSDSVVWNGECRAAYANGVPVGYWKLYKQIGKPNSTCSKNIQWESVLYSQGEFLNGINVGPWIWYHICSDDKENNVDETPMVKGMFDEFGVPVDKWTLYKSYSVGFIDYEIIFCAGVIVSLTEYYGSVPFEPTTDILLGCKSDVGVVLKKIGLNHFAWIK